MCRVSAGINLFSVAGSVVDTVTPVVGGGEATADPTGATGHP